MTEHQSKMRGCVVFGCSNSDYTLERWEQADCKIHSGYRNVDCSCPQPFKLFPFPTEKKNMLLRNMLRRLFKVLPIDTQLKKCTSEQHHFLIHNRVIK